MASISGIAGIEAFAQFDDAFGSVAVNDDMVEGDLLNLKTPIVQLDKVAFCKPSRIDLGQVIGTFTQHAVKDKARSRFARLLCFGTGKGLR